MRPFVHFLADTIAKFTGKNVGFDYVNWDDDTYKLASSLNDAIAEGEYVLTAPEPVMGLITPGLSWVVENCYGAECLVTKELIILDIDIRDLKEDGIDGCNSPKATTLRAAEKERIVAVMERHELPFRLYETACGHRLFIQAVEAGSDSEIADRIEPDTYQRLTEELKVDPKYLRISKEQFNYRARLTTKPWRSGGESLAASDPKDQDAAPLLIARLVAWGRQIEGLPGGRVIAHHDEVTGAKHQGTAEWSLA